VKISVDQRLGLVDEPVLQHRYRDLHKRGKDTASYEAKDHASYEGKDQAVWNIPTLKLPFSVCGISVNVSGSG